MDLDQHPYAVTNSDFHRYLDGDAYADLELYAVDLADAFNVPDADRHGDTDGHGDANRDPVCYAVSDEHPAGISNFNADSDIFNNGYADFDAYRNSHKEPDRNVYLNA